ncbi:MAG: hypothetical protein J6C09_01645 [Clostridia bacterium]|nr:hypothetical protein [Clostridia bacterium]
MKKSALVYSLVWTLCIALFNLVVFITPHEINGVDKFDATFWVGYIFITVAFLCHLVWSIIALQAENRKRVFYNIPLITISYSGLVTMLIFGSIFMAIPTFPEWVGIIVCVFVLVFNLISIAKAAAAIEIISSVDEKTESQTDYIKSLTANIQTLSATSATEEIRKEINSVYEAVRYSDPVSHPSLSKIELQITIEVNALSDAVKNEDAELTKEISKSIIALVEQRNIECRAAK